MGDAELECALLDADTDALDHGVLLVLVGMIAGLEACAEKLAEGLPESSPEGAQEGFPLAPFFYAVFPYGTRSVWA